MQHDALRSLIEWHEEYRPEWDGAPNQYAEHGFVGWGRSRRLGLFKVGDMKAYLGIQHVDPEKAGWGFAEVPHTRFFLSLFVSGRCITLRTFPTMDAALDMLDSFLRSQVP